MSYVILCLEQPANYALQCLADHITQHCLFAVIEMFYVLLEIMVYWSA